MGRRNYVVEGVSCSGKTSVCDELRRRGHHAIHGDRVLAYWGDPVTGTPVEPGRHEHWIWDLEKVHGLLADRGHPTTFLCGGSRNLATFAEALDAVFVLEIDLETLNRRLELRPDDEWGGSPSVGTFHAREELRQGRTLPGTIITVDASQPLGAVVDDILQHCRVDEPDGA